MQQRINWRYTFENIESTPTASRFQSIFASNYSFGLGTVKNGENSLTMSADEILETVMKICFPCSILVSTEDQDAPVSQYNNN